MMGSRWRSILAGTRAAACATALGLAGAGAVAQPGAGAPFGPSFTAVSGRTASPDADGFIRRWLVLDPIDKPNRSNSGFTATYVRRALTEAAPPGRPGALPRDGQTVRIGEPLTWHAVESTRFDVNLFHLAQALHKRTYGVIFWVTTVIDSPRELRDVRLAVGSNSASVWWLDGREAVGLFDDRRMVQDDVLSPRLTLRKGRTVIRGAIINGPGLSDFCLRFLDASGQPIRDLKVSVQ